MTDKAKVPPLLPLTSTNPTFFLGRLTVVRSFSLYSVTHLTEMYNFLKCIYLFLAAQGLHCCVGFSLVVVHGLLIGWPVLLGSSESRVLGLQ